MRRLAILGARPLFKKSIPISMPYLPPLKLILKDAQKAFSSGMITNAMYVKKLEAKVCKFLGVKNCLAVSSCTSGLMLTVRCLGLKGKVIVPSYTFPATVLALGWNNIEPIFVDIDSETYNIDPNLVETNITSDTSAIIATYVYGNPPDIDQLEKIAKKYKLKLIFDAAHAFGSRYKNKLVGSFGDAEIFSMSPTKLITAGEGGLITTDDDRLAKMLTIGRNYGDPGTNNCEFIGLNARLPELNAILGLETLKYIGKNIKIRNIIAKFYKTRLLKIPGISAPKVNKADTCAFKDFSILIDSHKFGLTREQLKIALAAENITARNYFYPPVHRQKAFAQYFSQYKDKLPITDYISNNIISLPIYSNLKIKEISKICDTIKNIYDLRYKIKQAFIKKKGHKK